VGIPERTAGRPLVYFAQSEFRRTANHRTILDAIQFANQIMTEIQTSCGALFPSIYP
jgi:hypothetical protein